MLRRQDKKIREMGNRHQDYVTNLFTHNKLSTSPASQLSENGLVLKIEK